MTVLMGECAHVWGNWDFICAEECTGSVLNSYLVYRGTWEVAATVKGHLSFGQQEAGGCN